MTWSVGAGLEGRGVILTGATGGIGGGRRQGLRRRRSQGDGRGPGPGPGG
ncbi:MAG: hypothetical protein WKF78_08970 [Candidatus Limnocylindrales bacterium]